MTLYHFTCDHGRAALGDIGTLLPLADWNPEAATRIPPARAWMTGVIWLTSERRPDRVALGLTSDTITCDRMAYRYRTVGTHAAVPYLSWWRNIPRKDHLDLTGWHEARPGQWWVSTEPVNVVLDGPG